MSTVSEFVAMRKADTVISNCKYILSPEIRWNSSINIAFKDRDIYQHSSDWLSLIYYYNTGNHPQYIKMQELYARTAYRPTDIYISGDSLLVSTSFSSGTVHGYVGFFDIIVGLNKLPLFTNYIIHGNMQQGMKDLVSIFLKDKNIVFITPGKLYEFEKLHLIPLIYHNYTYTLPTELLYIKNEVQPLLNQYIFNTPAKTVYKQVCVLKSSISTNMVADGIFQHQDIVNFCNKIGYTCIEPTAFSEDEYARIIHAATDVIFSWGTTHYKGLVYISDTCKHVAILAHGSGFIGQYKQQLEQGKTPHLYKNAHIEYIPIYSLHDKALDPFIKNTIRI